MIYTAQIRQGRKCAFTVVDSTEKFSVYF